MCERLKQAVLKTAVLERVPGVRIPLPPPAHPAVFIDLISMIFKCAQIVPDY